MLIDNNFGIIAGHGRVLGAKQLGLKEVPCIFIEDLTETQKRAYILADNKLSELSGWDNEILISELEALQDLDFDITLTGFDIDEININIDGAQEVEEDHFECAPPEEPKAKIGDIYQLGEHRLMCGDSADKATVERLMNGANADMSFTSPPYNVAGNIGYKNKKSKYDNYSDNKEDCEYVKFLVDFTKNAIDNSKFTFVNIQSLANNKTALINYLYEMQNLYADTMIWDKGYGTPAIAKRVLNSAYEYIHIFSENATRAIGTKDFQGTIPNVVHINKQHNNEYSDIHNATFPIEFAAYFINTFSNVSESILDLFGGTGTTLIACEQLNRKCYMLELEPKYIDVIISRWETFTGKTAVKIN